MAKPWVEELLGGVGAYKPPSAGGDEDVAGYIRSAAAQRGIDPEVAIKVAQSEGGLVPNRTGSFSTGRSFWPFQLHYGGPGYERFGNVAGMGNSFTAQTGYQPGDPAAWRAATDYALDAAAKNGWGAWYGARNAGITGRTGIGNPPAGRSATSLISTSNSKAEVPGDAPPWVRDLFSTDPGFSDASFRYGRDEGPGVAPLPNAPAGAPAWALELLSSPSSSAVSRGGPDYTGEAQTDEVWPVAGQRWGQVNNPFGGGQARSAGATVALPAYNVGADLTARYGAEVVAPVSGTVVEAYDAPNETDRNLNRGWGGMTLLRGDNGYFYRLSHAQPGSIATQPGQRVAQGQALQRVGTSGNTTGPHLDYEKFDQPGHFVDPVQGRGGTVGAAGGSGAAAGAASGPVPAWARELLGAT